MIVMFLSFCSDSEERPARSYKTPEVRQAEFSTMAGCLAGVANSSGSQLKPVRDKPDIVSGSQADGRTFACKRKSSGTKGTYYVGWYDAE